MTAGRKALVLAAHADDETLGAGGLIQQLVARQWQVDVVILADGIVRVRGVEQDNRGDAARACKLLGIDAPKFMGFPDQKFDSVPMADLAGAVGALGLAPDLIVTHVDTDLNRDHRLVCEVAKIIGRPRRGPVTILGVEIPATTFWNGQPFPANYFVGLTPEQLETKIAAFECYTNELGQFPHPWSREGLKLLAQTHGMHCGLPFAEAFVVIRGYLGSLP